MLLEKPKRERGYKKERIIRVLLNYDGEEITKYRVAKLANVSEPWCREYTERLESKGILQDTKILKVKGLYEEWKKIRIGPNFLSVSLQNPTQIIQDTNLDYALTTDQGENIIQGMLFPSVTDFYIKGNEIEDWLDLIKEHGVLGGGNTRVRATDEHVFFNHQKIEKFNIVSTPQLIIDLLEEGGPSEEAGAHLLERFHGD
ncbi:hypothetical protein AKJ50_00320 [candidate division MSBL1 archaeon SCGC-AAA382A13]|uniref:Uncharacterized protein n=1 Tax=candidate division MSBL1 archaeon SCGC-AAA382A13 TaxID=1698279 RepID=A0A133VGU5_9EURY|nr:hypothetical protein AKJ50_00320 [candidate division MSBL1 archaeon SCGC-AAA382A13]